jgi:hypothetical protein
MHKQKIGVLAAVGLGILGILLPWGSLGIFGSYNGFSSGWTGYGAIAALAAAAGFILKDLDNKEKPLDDNTKKIVMGAGAGAFVFPLLYIIILKTSMFGGAFGIGMGVYLTMLGGLAVLAIPFVIKSTGEMSMPTKDSIKEEIKDVTDGENDTNE